MSYPQYQSRPFAPSMSEIEVSAATTSRMPFVLNGTPPPGASERPFERRFNYFTTWIEAADATRHPRTFGSPAPCENIGRPRQGLRKSQMTYSVTLIPGDGVGPELTEATRRVLEATSVPFSWDVHQAGTVEIEASGSPLPDDVLDSIRENGVALKGPVSTPVGGGFRSVNVALRMELDLYACLRPCRWYPGVRSRYEGVDVVILRENTEA